MKKQQYFRRKAARLFGQMSDIREEFTPEISTQQIQVFFLVASDEGISPTEIANRLNIPKGTVSRATTKLGFRKREEPDGKVVSFGLGLLEAKQDDYNDTRRKGVYLTKKGREVLELLASSLN